PPDPYGAAGAPTSRGVGHERATAGTGHGTGTSAVVDGEHRRRRGTEEAPGPGGGVPVRRAGQHGTRSADQDQGRDPQPRTQGRPTVGDALRAVEGQEGRPSRRTTARPSGEAP